MRVKPAADLNFAASAGPKPKPRPRLQSFRSLGRLMIFVAFSGLVLAVAAQRPQPRPFGPRTRPAPPGPVPGPWLPGSPDPFSWISPEDRAVWVAPRGIDEAMIIPARVGIDEAMIVHPR